MTTGASYVAALSNVQANLFSDLLIHHMGSGLADGVSQGGAGPDQFRTAPLWGLGQRLFFLHDGSVDNIVEAINAHGGEASRVRDNFNNLSVGADAPFNLNTGEQQNLVRFLRSL